MIKKLWRWLYGCPGPCKFEIIQKFSIKDEVRGSIVPVGESYTSRCSTCGILKYQEFTTKY